MKKMRTTSFVQNYSVRKSKNSLDEKGGPLSEISLDGIPKRLKIFLKAKITLAAFMEDRTYTSIYFE